MRRRGGVATLAILLVLFALQAACEGQDNAGRGDSSAVQAARETGSVMEVTLRIEGMT
ncbi:MAG: hypothetical protein ACREIE_07115 [Nitrospiraceae bacterium]